MERALSPLWGERLGRLKAEWELAALRAEVARVALSDAAAVAARESGIEGAFDIDFSRGVLVARRKE